MQILRRVLLVLVFPIFTLLLFSVATTTLLVHQLGSSQPVKEVIASSGIYNSVVSGILDQSKAVNNNGSEVQLDNAVVKAAAEKSFSPQFIQTSTENVLDSIYRWLDGTVAEPDFKIDLGPVKTDFANNVSEELSAELAKLPVCATVPANFDAMTATCLPKGVAPTTAAEKVKTDILSGKGLLDHPVITSASIKKDDTAQSVFASEQLKQIPEAFQALKSAPLILGVVAVLLAIVVVFLSATRRSGIKKVGFGLISVGVGMLALGLLINWSAKHTDFNTDLTNKVLASNLEKLLQIIGNRIGDNYWQFGAGYIITGALMCAGAIFLMKQREGHHTIQGEGRTKEDRIELHEPVKATAFEDDNEESASSAAAEKPAPAVAKKKPTPRATKPTPKPDVSKPSSAAATKTSPSKSSKKIVIQ